MLAYPNRISAKRLLKEVSHTLSRDKHYFKRSELDDWMTGLKITPRKKLKNSEQIDYEERKTQVIE